MNGRYVVDENGKRVAVLLDIQEYERMVEEIEELEDARAAAEVRAAIERGRRGIDTFRSGNARDRGRQGQRKLSYHLIVSR